MRQAGNAAATGAIRPKPVANTAGLFQGNPTRRNQPAARNLLSLMKIPVMTPSRGRSVAGSSSMSALVPLAVVALVLVAALTAALMSGSDARADEAEAGEQAAAIEGAGEFRAIFNGENLDGWAGDERFWSVEDGVIVGEATADNPVPHNTFLIWDEGEVDDFELTFRYRITSEQANSGVQVRSQRHDNYIVSGYQPDIATTDWITGIIYEERGRGILARRGEKVVIDAEGNREATRFAEEAELGEHVKGDDWNDYHVIARGNHLVVKVNGEVMSELVDDGPEAARSGIVAFQLHTGPPMRIEFKDIELKRLPLADDRKKVVMVAGTASHGYGAHEHYAGLKLFKDLLHEHTDNIVATIYRDGWPSDPTAFDNADTVVIYANGGGGHPVIPHLDSFATVMDRGVGLVCLHYAVEIPTDRGGDRLLEWMGGYFETHWSVNPHWVLRDMELNTDHPITRGVEPYVIDDEWYYHMRFREAMDGVAPIISALPPDSSLSRDDGPHSGNPDVRAAVLERRETQHTAWAAERPNGGRGFGFTGGHWHWNWGHPGQLKIALNAIVWTARGEIPEQGIDTPAPTMEQLEAHQDYDMPENFNRQRWADLVEEWQGDVGE